jgi:hypothetical protein
MTPKELDLSEQISAVAVLSDAFDRIAELVEELTEGLTESVATYRPDAATNTVAWLLWHLTRVQDDHISDAAGITQVWPEWTSRFGLPFDETATGYGQSADDVAQVVVSGELLAGYHAAVHQATMRYVATLSQAELDRVVDKRWDPPVTVAVRLVSVVSDCLQHLGQAALVRGLAERRSRTS